MCWQSCCALVVLFLQARKQNSELDMKFIHSWIWRYCSKCTSRVNRQHKRNLQPDKQHSPGRPKRVRKQDRQLGFLALEVKDISIAVEARIAPHLCATNRCRLHHGGLFGTKSGT